MFSPKEPNTHYERLSEDIDETLPLYETRPKSDFAPPPTLGASAQLHASPTVVVSTTDNFDFKKYVPYQLELEKCGLFPEFLYHFKKNFSAESAENRAYCRQSVEEFTACYVGHEKDISGAVARVEADFDQKFRKCLHPDLLREFVEWTFTRGCVENEFRTKLGERGDIASGPIRLEVLTESVKKISHCKVDELVEFFRAFGYSEQFFWVYIMQSLGWTAVEYPHNQNLLNSTARKWQAEEGTLERRAQGFVDEYKTQLHVPKYAYLREFIIPVVFFALIILVIVLIIILATRKQRFYITAPTMAPPMHVGMHYSPKSVKLH